MLNMIGRDTENKIRLDYNIILTCVSYESLALGTMESLAGGSINRLVEGSWSPTH
jgi:hypothetical protein